MENINVPSLSSLATNIRQAKSIQELYDYISRWKQEVDEGMQDALTYKNVYIGGGDTYTEAMIDANHYDSIRCGSTTSVTLNNEYLWVILPSNYSPSILMGGLTMPMTEQSNVEVEGITYKVFQSDLLDASTVNIILL